MSRVSSDQSEHIFLALENLLQHAHPRQDMSPAIHTMRLRFRSPYALLNADSNLLEKCGLDSRDALLLSKLRELSRVIAGSGMEKAKMDTLIQTSQYIVDTMRSLTVEQFHLFCLDSRGRLIRRIILEEGIEDSALFSMKDMVTKIIRISPKGVFLAHNHPHCTRTPSLDDILCTREAIEALQALDVPLLDHIIVAGGSVVSLRACGYVPTLEWIRQDPESRMLRNWLSDAPQTQPDF